MIRVVLSDGDVFQGESWSQVVEHMRLGSPLEPDPSNAEYMKGVSRRCKVVNGSIVDTHDEEAFIRSLQKAGFVTEIKEGQ